MWMQTESSPLASHEYLGQPIGWCDDRPLQEIKPNTSFKENSLHAILPYDQRREKNQLQLGIVAFAQTTAIGVQFRQLNLGQLKNLKANQDEVCIAICK